LKPVQHKSKPVVNRHLPGQRHELLTSPAPDELHLPVDKPAVLHRAIETPFHNPIAAVVSGVREACSPSPIDQPSSLGPSTRTAPNFQPRASNTGPFRQKIRADPGPLASGFNKKGSNGKKFPGALMQGFGKFSCALYSPKRSSAWVMGY
jgi:hypothetical protein